MKSIEFIVPGVPVPYVRTTQKQKYISRQYKRYQGYKSWVQMHYMKALSELRSKFTENAEQTSTTCSKDILTPSMGLPSKMTDNVSTQESCVKVKLVFYGKKK